MPTTQEYVNKVKNLSKDELVDLWNNIKSKNTPDWDNGKAFEFLILRLFELEGAIIRYPYSVDILGESNAEQIDGVIHFEELNLSVIVEFKDYSKNVNIEPIAKLRNQLLRRPSNAIGSIFSTTGFTMPALILTQFIAPQTILLWEKDHIEHCICNKLTFKEGLLKKYRHAIEEGNSNYDITI